MLLIPKIKQMLLQQKMSPFITLYIYPHEHQMLEGSFFFLPIPEAAFSNQVVPIRLMSGTPLPMEASWSYAFSISLSRAGLI